MYTPHYKMKKKEIMYNGKEWKSLTRRNGTDGKTDVYKLEEATSSTGSLEKVASTGELKIAVEETSTNKKYNVVYCKTESDKEMLGTLEDNAKNEDLITFTVDGKSYKAKQGMTWEDWIKSDYCDETEGMFKIEMYMVRILRNGITYDVCNSDEVAQRYDTVILNHDYVILEAIS